MTEEEREADDRRLDEASSRREEVKQFNFLEKYYKNLLPTAMQLRRGQFGKKGQVKHTHLTDVDTTDQTAAWSQHTKVMEKYQQKMSTAKSINVFDRQDMSASSRA